MNDKQQQRTLHGDPNDTANRHSPSWMSSFNIITCCTMNQNYVGNINFSATTRKRWGLELNKASSTDLLYSRSTQTCDFLPYIIVISKMSSHITLFHLFPTLPAMHVNRLPRCDEANAHLLAGSLCYLISIKRRYLTSTSFSIGKSSTPFTRY